MSIIDSETNTCYWDFVNWIWLPYIKKESKQQSTYYFERKLTGERIRVSNKDEAVSLVGGVYNLQDIKTISLRGNSIYEVAENKFLVAGRLVEFGRSTPSILSFSKKAYGINFYNVYKKTNNRVSQLDFVNTYQPVRNNEKSFVVGKIEYNNLKDFVEKNNLNYQTVIHKRKKGVEYADILARNRKKYINFKHTFKGETYTSVKDFSKATGISTVSVYKYHKMWKSEGSKETFYDYLITRYKGAK